MTSCMSDLHGAVWHPGLVAVKCVTGLTFMCVLVMDYLSVAAVSHALHDSTAGGEKKKKEEEVEEKGGRKEEEEKEEKEVREKEEENEEED